MFWFLFNKDSRFPSRLQLAQKTGKNVNIDSPGGFGDVSSVVMTSQFGFVEGFGGKQFSRAIRMLGIFSCTSILLLPS